MNPDEVKKLIKRMLIVGIFFALALFLFKLGSISELLGLGRMNGRPFLVAYVLIVAVLMVCAILLQAGRGGGLASLGGLSGDSLLGTRSATPIAKATYVMAALVLFICMLIAIVGPPERGVSGALPESGGPGPGAPLEAPVEEDDAGGAPETPAEPGAGEVDSGPDEAGGGDASPPPAIPE